MDVNRLRIWTLFLAFAASLVVACAAPNASPTVTPEAVGELQLVLAGDDLAAGEPRVPFVLYDGVDFATGVERVVAELFDLSDEEPRRIWSGDVERFTDYEVPYYVVYPQVPAAGNWGLGLSILHADGRRTQASAILRVAAAPSGPAIGTAPPASENRTLADEPDIALLSTGQEPIPALYAMTVAEAMASGRPSVVTFTTPRFCSSSLCAPVLDSVEAVYDAEKERANFIHIEVYKEYEPLVLADEVEAWGLPSEPWTFVLDKNGVVRARLAGPVSPRELTAALTAVK